ncbi:hypothetical protein ABIF53_007841 [Bradyrhizobium japonicum]
MTTLGRALAGRLALPHHDSDDYFWLPTAPPYQTTRPGAERLRLMREMFLPRLDWVLSGIGHRLGRGTRSVVRSRRLRHRTAKRSDCRADVILSRSNLQITKQGEKPCSTDAASCLPHLPPE